MKRYKVDLHIHSCLSPCGSLDMDPESIVETALRKGLDAIAITDHNSTLQCPVIQELGQERGLLVLAGVEVTTSEEVHCLVLFKDEKSRQEFQAYLDQHLPPIPNDPDYLGDQVWVNARNEIQGEVAYSLLSAIDQSLEQVESKCAEVDGLFIAAHIDRPSFSVISQLGFISPQRRFDAIEYSNYQRFSQLIEQQGYLSKYIAYSASDAHQIDQIGEKYAILESEELSFNALRNILKNKDKQFIYSHLNG